MYTVYIKNIKAKLLIGVIAIAAILILAFRTNFSTLPKQQVATDVLPSESSQLDATLSQDHAYCFVYRHAGTADEPYTVEEHLILQGTREDFTGVKSGTQSGPDMTNGYTGTIVGSVTSNVIEDIYSYTIEGSKQKEKEIYIFSGMDLVKERYPLVDQGGVLVPDTTGTRRDLTYVREVCN